MTQQIPGVPDGWEIEHAARIGEAGEHTVDRKGEPFLLSSRSLYLCCIIRKIE
jgi:hypothetical protein